MRFTCVVLMVLCAASTAGAQDAMQTTRFEGTVRMVVGGNLIVTTGKGDMMIALTPHTRVQMRRGGDVNVADLKPGTTIGANTTKGADGKFAATFITIEPVRAK